MQSIIRNKSIIKNTYLHFKVIKLPIWIKWLARPHQSPDLKQMIGKPASNDSRSALCSINLNPLWCSDLYQMIHVMRSEWSASKLWIILWRNGLTDSEFRKASFHSSLNIQALSEFLNEWLFLNRLNWLIEVTSSNQSEQFQHKWLTQFNRFVCSSAFHVFGHVYTTLSVLLLT